MKRRTEVYCKQIFKYSGNTTNLRFQKSHHCKEFKEVEQAAQPSITSRVSKLLIVPTIAILSSIVKCTITQL